jgi:hypothetical protein
MICILYDYLLFFACSVDNRAVANCGAFISLARGIIINPLYQYLIIIT